MIKKIGFKRLGVIVVLLGILGVALFFNFFVFSAKKTETQNRLAELSGEASTLNEEIATMRADMDRFNQHRQLFDTITKTGFFNDQERVAARARLDAIQKLSKVISARYEIRAAEIIDDENIGRTDYVIVRTPVSISLTALTDIDVYRYIYYLNYAYPGNVAISTLRVARIGEINQDTLRSIGTGAPPTIMEATIEFTWTSMASRAAMLLPPRTPDAGEPQAETTDIEAGGQL